MGHSDNHSSSSGIERQSRSGVCNELGRNWMGWDAMAWEELGESSRESVVRCGVSVQRTSSVLRERRQVMLV